MTYPASGTLRSRREPVLAGARLILIAGLIHLLLTPQLLQKRLTWVRCSSPTSSVRS
jgi:hypothetical protein